MVGMNIPDFTNAGAWIQAAESLELQEQTKLVRYRPCDNIAIWYPYRDSYASKK
jgi:hypothetical protein